MHIVKCSVFVYQRVIFRKAYDVNLSSVKSLCLSLLVMLMTWKAIFTEALKGGVATSG